MESIVFQKVHACMSEH